MILKDYNQFLDDYVHEGDFEVTVDMISYGNFNNKIPREVTGDFLCRIIGLTSLKGSPEKVGGSFTISNTRYTPEKQIMENLEGSPKYVGKNFTCSNTGLLSLKGAPERINGNFNCGQNFLTSLEGGPKYVEGEFNASNNNEDLSLKGAPEYVGGRFRAANSNVSTLYGIPKGVTEIDFSMNGFALSTEVGFILSGSYKDDYWMDLLKFVIQKNRDLSTVQWPEGFLNDNLKKAAKGIGKYDL